MYIPNYIKKPYYFDFCNHKNSHRSGDITKTIILPIFTTANLFYANYDNNSLYQLLEHIFSLFT